MGERYEQPQHEPTLAESLLQAVSILELRGGSTVLRYESREQRAVLTAEVAKELKQRAAASNWVW